MTTMPDGTPMPDERDAPEMADDPRWDLEPETMPEAPECPCPSGAELDAEYRDHLLSVRDEIEAARMDVAEARGWARAVAEAASRREPDAMLTTDEVAEILSIEPDTARRWARTHVRGFPSVKPTNEWCVRFSSLQAWVDRREHDATAPTDDDAPHRPLKADDPSDPYTNFPDF